MILKALLTACLLFIFYQDMRYRAICWICFPVLLLLLLTELYGQLTLRMIMESRVWNLLFLGAQLLLVSVYFSLKSRKWIAITDHYLGWGDVLFLIVAGCYLSPLNYLFFYVFTLILILLLTFLSMIPNRVEAVKIPMAGLQAVFLGLFMIYGWYNESISPVSDTWLLTYINP